MLYPIISDTNNNVVFINLSILFLYLRAKNEFTGLEHNIIYSFVKLHISTKSNDLCSRFTINNRNLQGQKT